jgi:pimeloyl-ACP methyl ester carboxylesterase/DNA-binding CsgD family transcriptional regulator
VFRQSVKRVLGVSGSKSVSEERAPGRPDLAVALDAIYGYATDPENWEEMSSLLDEIGAGADIEPVAEGMRAHLSRAESLAQRLHETAPDDNASPAYCHMVIGRDLRVADISEAAREMLTPFCKPLRAGGPLLFTDPENAARFRALAASVTQGAVGPVLLRLVLEDGEEAVFGYLVAEANLPEPLRRRFDLPAETRRGAIAVVAPDREAAGDATRMYRETFGLTPAEARLAAHLKDGYSLKEAAAKLNVSVNTARNQIKSVFEKLGVNRQSDLIRHLTELSQLATYISAAQGEGGERPVPAAPGDVPLAFVELPDGRRLAWRGYGRRDGLPVVMFPSSVSSSYIWSEEAEAAARFGLRYIVVERPGTGASTADPDLTFESFARDFEHFVDALGLERFHLVARSSASPFALTAAARLGPRVRLLMLTSARLGVPEGSRTKPLGMLGAFFSNLRRYPWLLDSTLFILRAKMSRNFIRPLVYKFFEQSPADVALIRSTPALEAAMIRCTMETIAHTYAGLLRESQLYLDGVSLDLAGLTAPILVWHGEADGVVPIGEMKRRLAELGIEPAEMRSFPGDGHCFLNRHYEEIFARLAAG